MTKYNIYCKDETILNDIHAILASIAFGVDNVKLITSGFMPKCISFSTEVYSDEGIMKLLKDNDCIYNHRNDFFIFRQLHRREVL